MRRTAARKRDGHDRRPPLQGFRAAHPPDGGAEILPARALCGDRRAGDPARGDASATSPISSATPRRSTRRSASSARSPPTRRINALEHPIERITQHKVSYRPNEYFRCLGVDEAFRGAPAGQSRDASAMTSGSAMARWSCRACRSATARWSAPMRSSRAMSAPYEIVAGVPAQPAAAALCAGHLRAHRSAGLVGLAGRDDWPTRFPTCRPCRSRPFSTAGRLEGTQFCPPLWLRAFVAGKAKPLAFPGLRPPLLTATPAFASGH